MKRQKSFDKLQTTGTLYLVPTPIGNLEDMTFRAVRMLEEADVIASEDTRNTQKLLNHFEIKTPQTSFHEHNYKERIPEFVVKLTQGETIAQVSDAGMPSISDPGYELVTACIEHGLPVVALPGATAGLTALIASGLPPQYFSFFGFLPRKKNERETVLEGLRQKKETIIFYESPYRLKTTFASLETVYGPERKAVLSRELTKIHEEYIRGTLAELAAFTEENVLKGECCILVEGLSEELEAQTGEEEWATLTLAEHVQELIESEGYSSKEAIKTVAQLRQLKKQEVYRAYHVVSE